MKIRREQMRHISESQKRTFVKRMGGHLSKYFPEYVDIVGHDRLAAEIESGIAKAESYGIVDEQDVCDFLALRCVLGPDFDEDPNLPWARQILENEGIEDAHIRTITLYKRAEDNFQT